MKKRTPLQVTAIRLKSLLLMVCLLLAALAGYMVLAWRRR